MGEVWVAAAVTVVGSVASGVAAEKKDKSDKKHQQAMNREESAMAAQRTSHEMALEDFYTQKNRAGKQRGLAQYKQFSTMGEVSPGYDPNTEVAIDPGKAPQYGDFTAGSNDGSGGVQAGVGSKGVAAPSLQDVLTSKAPVGGG